MAYDGLIYRHPYTGQPIGVPGDMYIQYLRARDAGEYIGKPVPKSYNIVQEPDGSTWQYIFSYDSPYIYESKTQLNSATGDGSDNLTTDDGASTTTDTAASSGIGCVSVLLAIGGIISVMIAGV